MKNINVEKREVYFGLSFNDYLQLPGYSHSFLKNNVSGVPVDVLETRNIVEGKLVDALIFGEPIYELIDNECVISAVKSIKADFKWLLDVAKYQVSFTCDFCHENLRMPFRGRADMVTETAVIDLKYTRSRRNQFRSTCNYLKYSRQLYGYSLGLDKKDQYILMVNDRGQYDLFSVEPTVSDYLFYAEAIKNFGA